MESAIPAPSWRALFLTAAGTALIRDVLDAISPPYGGEPRDLRGTQKERTPRRHHPWPDLPGS